MSLDKAIEYGKEHRQPYRGSRRFDRSCRNHGGCPYCEPGRQHNRIQVERVTAWELREWRKGH